MAFPCVSRFLLSSIALFLAFVTSAQAEPPAGHVEMVDAAHVRLLPGSPFYDRQELHRTGYVGHLDPDRLLFEYRKLAGLPQAPGITSGYAGWDSGFIKGHMAGHYLSAASRMAVATGDESFRKKANYLVAELAKCQQALNQDGYLAAFPSVALDWQEGSSKNSGGVVVPYYTIHKIMAGLVDAYHYLGNQQALDVALKMSACLQKRLFALPPDRIERMFRTDQSRNPQTEFGGMSDVLSELYSITGDKKQLQLAELFNRPWLIDPLAADEDHLKDLHANTHIAQLVGVARYANLTGDATDTRASENFWEIVTRHHSFAIGGVSFHEWFDGPDVEAGPSIDDGKRLPPTTAESCDTYNMLKLTALLIERTPDRADYADYFERALYNHLLATVAPDTGAMTYFTPLHGDFRTYLDGTYCCVGTGIENTARCNEGIYFQRPGQLWVNLYIPSMLDWSAQGLMLKQEGFPPFTDTVRLTVVRAVRPAEATLHFRVPDWVSGPVELSVNGQPQPATAKPSSYLAVKRVWQTGDVVTLKLPAALRLERAGDVPSMVSVFYGPVLLAGRLGNDGMPRDFADKDAYLKLPVAPVPTIVNASANPTDWLTLTDAATLTFKAHDAGPASGLVFQPLYAVHHERYSVYWELADTATPILPLSASAAPVPTYRAWAATPPMGWNSWDAFGTAITETQAKAEADVMADKLLPHGWNIFTVDIQWYEPASQGFGYRKDAKLTMDAYGRLLPAVEKFPSAANGAGFKPLADYVHAKGLKFGIHVMRGIPRQAVTQNTPILGSNARAADIAITSNICMWNPDMFGVDATKPSGQAYYDSLMALYASWGVDFIKVDDLSRPYDDVQLAEVEAIRRAIDKTGRPIIFSTSPGATPLARGEHIATYANMWRISDDFWDKWPALHEQFKRLHDWTPYRAPGAWPDADMLPLGIIERGRSTRFTSDEQRTMMTLWSIARSPLILGADMTKLDEATLALLTNDEVLAVNQASTGNRQLFEKGDLIAWVADVTGSKDKYLAVFNTGDAPAPVPVELSAVGFTGRVAVRDLWARRIQDDVRDTFAPVVPPHGSALYRLRAR